MDGFSPLVAGHATAATLAMVLGAVNVLRRRRGDPAHRLIGRVWVVAMYLTAGSSFWIQDLRPGSFSWIHGLSVLTLVTLTLGLWRIRRGDVRSHAAHMIGTYLGLLGAFAGVVAVPTRLIPSAFQQDWVGMAVVTAAIVAAGLGFTWLVTRLLPASVGPPASGGLPSGGDRSGVRPPVLPVRHG